jgi:hypothetical protein
MGQREMRGKCAGGALGEFSGVCDFTVDEKTPVLYSMHRGVFYFSLSDGVMAMCQRANIIWQNVALSVNRAQRGLGELNSRYLMVKTVIHCQ